MKNSGWRSRAWLNAVIVHVGTSAGLPINKAGLRADKIIDKGSHSIKNIASDTYLEFLSATMQEVAKIDSRFAHTLLFSCPECNLPVTVVRISDRKKGEEIDGERIRFKCGFCDHAALAYGVTAKMHYVYGWD